MVDADREDLIDCVSRLMPERATSAEAMLEASRHAVEAMEAELPRIRKDVSKTPDPLARKTEIVRQYSQTVCRIRNDWLKAHGAYRNG